VPADSVRGRLERGALEETIGRSSTACSREQIGQFWINRLWRQKLGIAHLNPGRLGADVSVRRVKREGG
jgi:hypothetical protein